MIVDESKEGRLALLIWEPAVRRSIILPELADVLDLPATDWAARLFAGTGRRQALTQSPAAHRGAMDNEAMTAKDLRSGKAIRARRQGAEQLAQRCRDQIGQRHPLVATRRGRTPTTATAFGAGGQIGSVEFVKARATEAEFGGGLVDRNLLCPKTPQHIPHKRSGMAGVKLLVVFIARRCLGRGRERTFSSAFATLRLRKMRATSTSPPLIAHAVRV